MGKKRIAVDASQAHIKALTSSMAFKPDAYEYDDTFRPANTSNPLEVHTVPELMELLENDKTIEVDARVLVANKKDETLNVMKCDRAQLLENYKKNNRKRSFKEAFDAFQFDDTQFRNQGLVGDDYVPLLGGPFNKQLYYYDYLRMHAMSFQAYHHDPIAKALISITRDFVLGRGFEVKCKDESFAPIWDSFSEVNDLQQHMDHVCVELSLYGEVMTWWLPNRDTRIQYRVSPGQEPSKGLIPRIRLIDPSVIWEVVTFPEDITRVLYYQWIAPTQYQQYTGTSQGSTVPGTKFIFQQLPADQVQHVKINSVSNEKRGRSDLFPILGYLKRLRDTINYSVIALQKTAAWSIDTTIQGSQSDLDAYVEDQQQLGTIAPAGSEFVHTDKIKREYLANVGGSKGGGSQTFEWQLSMICAGFGIPISYLGTHLSGGQTRASAIVATEPVAKRWQHRQKILERILKDYARKLGKAYGYSHKECEIDVIFPEIVMQDRSLKLKDLAMAEQMDWLSKKRTSEIAAKEFGIEDFDYDEEQKDVLPMVLDPMNNPLTSPQPPTGKTVQQPASPEPKKSNSISGEERQGIKLAR